MCCTRACARTWARGCCCCGCARSRTLHMRHLPQLRQQLQAQLGLQLQHQLAAATAQHCHQAAPMVQSLPGKGLKVAPVLAGRRPGLHGGRRHCCVLIAVAATAASINSSCGGVGSGCACHSLCGARQRPHRGCQRCARARIGHLLLLLSISSFCCGAARCSMRQGQQRVRRLALWRPKHSSSQGRPRVQCRLCLGAERTEQATCAAQMWVMGA